MVVGYWWNCECERWHVFKAAFRVVSSRACDRLHQQLHQAAINRKSVHPKLTEWNENLDIFSGGIFDSTSSIWGNE